MFGSDWLNKTDLAHKRWPIIWLELWDYVLGRPEQESLAQCGRRFLEAGPINRSYLEQLSPIYNQNGSISPYFSPKCWKFCASWISSAELGRFQSALE